MSAAGLRRGRAPEMNGSGLRRLLNTLDVCTGPKDETATR